MSSPTIADLLTHARGLRVLFVHAHPDDDTLSTGPLIAWLARQGADVSLLTCCRGERGEVVPGVLPDGASPVDLVEARERELDAACTALGVRQHWFLGAAPWRARGRAERHYEDSGMRWVTPTVAGPARDASELSLTRASLDEEVADVLAGLRQLAPEIVLSYDEGGGYGHPDHLRVHQVVEQAARHQAVGFVAVLSNDDVPGTDTARARWFESDDPAVAQAVLAALRCYRSQLTVVGEGADSHIRHVGGQRQEIPRRVGLIE
ncbi:N-acetyl-1-D-myo-inositol-2-amino-2-deoxy-alpha-D-glucopyranoside deacetylase [Propionibacterium cyclohexanicum]|uniref:N-acetyl-1-D-myo-inositol-2-amino-2-deoxy-alpha-D-glucopyranoside deacetylase n=1 Tax=Propionibacterium cyclohexanicum TaxID=64702 RepID=A0A1H9RLC2_9ACTN|nr:PIG-L family deacetylase [Propionibacterium cyclohexanicum]SER73572.1 N-acetyl-1-D-myo-inositol-2-amino-2-deoxy-alpha-D-glucopyranoside deacetylase [Propionibacterium cyclohexanicum]